MGSRRPARTEEQLRYLSERQRCFDREVGPMRQALLSFAMRQYRDRDLAEDLVQETLMGCYRNFDQFEVGSNLKAWLCRCLVNRAINHRRSNRERVFEKATRLDAPNENGEPWLLNSMIVADHGRFYDDYLRDELAAAVRALPLILRGVFVLAMIEELPHYEICEILGLEAGTLKSRLFRARNSVTKHLKRFAEQEGYRVKSERRPGAKRHEPNRKRSEIVPTP